MSNLPFATLSTLMRGLIIRSVECALHFNRPTPVRPLASATIRGLAGHLLTATHPECVRRLFKPGHQGHHPAAFLFETLTHQFGLRSSLRFRIRTWDPSGELLSAFQDAFRQARCNPFGESGARIEAVSFGDVEFWEFEQNHPSILRATLEFLTPTRLKAAGGWLGKEDVTLGHIVEAAIRRLEALSDHYGSRSELDERPLLAAASKVRETARSLRWISPRRRSSSQGIDLALSGLVGYIQFAELPGVLVDLFNAVALFHIGHKTTEGCGEFRLVG